MLKVEGIWTLFFKYLYVQSEERRMHGKDVLKVVILTEVPIVFSFIISQKLNTLPAVDITFIIS